MKSIWRIITFTRELWPAYIIVSVLSIFVAVLTQVVPLLTKAVIDHISKGLQSGHTTLTPVIIIAVIIFLCDIGQAAITNANGHIGDMLSSRLNKLLSNRYYEHIMSLPQKYFDTELSGTVINRLNRG